MICAKCGEKINLLYPKVKFESDWYHSACFKEVKQELSKENKENFSKTNAVQNYFWVDDVNKKWLVPTGVFKKGLNYDTKIYNYSDILKYELLSNNSVVSSGGVGGAIVGGALFGGAGAVTGGLLGRKTHSKSDLSIKITLNSLSEKPVYINLITAPVDTNSLVFKTQSKIAQDIISMLDVITAQNQ